MTATPLPRRAPRLRLVHADDPPADPPDVLSFALRDIAERITQLIQETAPPSDFLNDRLLAMRQELYRLAAAATHPANMVAPAGSPSPRV